MDFFISSMDRLFKIKISDFAPTCSNAFAESYSQFVPGNTEIITLGTSTGFVDFLTDFSVTLMSDSLPESSVGISGENTFSKVFLYAKHIFSFFSFVPFTIQSEFVMEEIPIFSTPSISALYSITNEPNNFS